MRDSDSTPPATPGRLTALAALVARTRHPVAITGADHRMRWVNGAFTRTLGLEPQEVYGRSPDEFFHMPDSRRTIGEFLEAGRSGEEGFRIEVAARTQDGRTVRLDVDCMPFFDRAGAFGGHVAIHVDVTGRRTGDQPQQSDDLEELTADSLIDGIDELLQGQVLYASRGAYARQRLRLFRSPGAPFEVAYTNGRTLRIQDHRLRDGGTLSVGADVTEAKRRERSLQDAQEAAELASLAKSRLLIGVE